MKTFAPWTAADVKHLRALWAEVPQLSLQDVSTRLGRSAGSVAGKIDTLRRAGVAGFEKRERKAATLNPVEPSPIADHAKAMKTETDRQASQWGAIRFDDHPAARRREVVLRGHPEPAFSPTGCAAAMATGN